MKFRTWFERIVDETPEHPLLVTADEQYTYQDVDERANSVAQRLNPLLNGTEPTVLVMLPNCPAYVFSLLGLPKIGAVAACVNTEMRGESLVHLIETASAQVGIVAEHLLDQFVTAMESNDSMPEHLFTVDTGQSGSNISIPDGVTAHGPLLETVSDKSDRRPADNSDCHEGILQTLLHTSGTTGVPKWCRIPQNYHVQIGETIANTFEIDSSDVVFNPLPLYHTNPQCYYLYGTIAAGATAAMVDSFSASAFWEQVRAFETTVLILHIAPVDIVKKQTSPDETTENDIRVMFPADQEFMERFDVPVGMGGYGSTEAAGLTHLHRTTLPMEDELPENERLSQLAGTSRDDIEIRLVDEHDNPVDQTDPGEILIRPDEPFVIFDGYHNQPEKTVDAWQNLWFHTGDLGYIDDEGRLHFLSRIEESIRVKGQFVNVDLVERIFRRYDSIAECAAVGVPAEIGEEELVLFVQPASGRSPTISELREFVEDELPGFMRPSKIEFVESMPRTPGTEKIQKSKLVKQR